MENSLQKIIAQAVHNAYGLDVEPQISPAEPQFGDFATNVAFSLAGRLKQAPKEVAEELAKNIKDVSIDTVQSAGGGFINITMSTSFWVEQLARIDANYGKNQTGAGKKLQVEFISANPTGPTTIGNARGGYIGDALARVLSHSGYDVVREYYFNNAGTQINKLLESVKVAAGLITAEEVQYRGAYVDELAEEFKDELSTKSDDELKELLTTAILKRYIEPAVAKMGITFDDWFNEQDLITDGSFEQTIAKLRDKGLVFERDGATWLDSGKLGVEREERVIIKSNGDPTYLAPDIAYHDKLFGERGFDIAIKVLGPDHIDQFPSVKAAVLALHPKKHLEMAGHQWFRLIKDGKEVKISKRLGQIVTIEQLIDEVGANVARFFTLMRSAESHMDFDLDLAKEQSQKNPLFYVMYAYARAHSIMGKAGERGLKPAAGVEQLDKEEIQLVKQMAQFPGLIEQIASDYGVHRLTFYGLELARLFHDYYETRRIIDLPAAEAAEKLFIIQRFITFMKIYFSVVGITPTEKM